MAKSKGRNRQNSRNTRVTSDNSTRRVRFPSYIHQLDLFDDLPKNTPLTEFEDLRTHYPVPSRPLQAVGRNTRVVPRPNVPNPFGSAGIPHFLGFEVPERVLVCVRRKVRKQVIHATNKAGRGGQRKPRRNNNSNIWC